MSEQIDAPSAVESAATLLRQASTSRIPCPPVRSLLPAGSVEHAYRVQELNRNIDLLAGRRLVGWKIGLTNPSVQRQLGVDQPDTGALFADMEAGDGDAVALNRMMQPKVEAEIAFVLDADLPEVPVTSAAVLRATAFVLPAIEIVDSRIERWDIDIVDTVADNASSGLYVLGTTPKRLFDVDVRAATMALTADGVEVSSGAGANCLGNPVNAMVWLANVAVAQGRPLAAGDVVLSGALGPMVPVVPGAAYEATIAGVGSVRVAFEGSP